MITRETIKRGFETGAVRLVVMDGIVCFIGDNWFYFGGETAENYSDVESYIKDMGFDEVVDSIVRTLYELSTEFEDEFAYYDAYLSEMEQAVKKITDSLVEYFNGVMREQENTDYSLSNISVKVAEGCLSRTYHVTACMEYTWYLNAWDKRVRIENALFIFSEGKWYSPYFARKGVTND